MVLSSLVDREAELGELLRRWQSATQGSAQLVAVLGRRQVGKTFLLQHLLKSVRAGGAAGIYAGALLHGSEPQQLAALTRGIREGLSDEGALLAGDLTSWPQALDWLAAVASRRPLAVVLDEVPWLVDATRTLPSHLQQVWDRLRAQAEPSHLLLVMCGSAITAMQAMVDGAGPLYGRAARMSIEPFDLSAASELLGRPDAATVIEAFAACGGYPLHLAAWDVDETAEANLLRLAAASDGLLFRNATQLLVDVPGGGYRRVLHAIGMGASRRVDIERSAGQRIEQPLDILLRSGLVATRRPLASPDRTPARYEIADPYLRCWYAICGADQGAIEGGQGEDVLRRRFQRWQRHLGWTFEELARQHASQLSRSGELPRGEYGEWWRDRGGQIQIDVLGMEGGRAVLVGEVRWDRRPLQLRDLSDLRAKAARAPDPIQDTAIAFWSRGGVDPTVRAAGAHSYTPPDMVGE